MGLLKITKISIFDSILFLYYLDNEVEKRVVLSFSIREENILLNFNKNNSFLRNFQFNHLSIENFLLKLITNTVVEKDILITEDDLPF